MIDLGEEHDEHAFDSMHINSELISNKSDDTDSQYTKHNKQITRIIEFSAKSSQRPLSGGRDNCQDAN
jgi:hypothetical protein